MSEKQSELQRREILRLSNEESNKLTKECIETALIELMKDQDFNDISITNIVKRAGVSRTAYYRNYGSKEDILNTMLETVVDNITDEMNLQAAVGNWRYFWLTMFCRVREYAELYQILLKAGFEGAILSGINRVMQNGINKSDVPESYRLCFWSGAVYNVLTKWVSEGVSESDETMADICSNVFG